MSRRIPGTPEVKLGSQEVLSTTKSKKRRRSEASAELWDLGDTPTAPRRRGVTRLSTRRGATRLSMRRNRESDYDGSSTDDGATFIETYKREPNEYEYYRITSTGKVRVYDRAEFEEDSEDILPHRDVTDNGSGHEGNEEDHKVNKVQTKPRSCAKVRASIRFYI